MSFEVPLPIFVFNSKPTVGSSLNTSQNQAIVLNIFFLSDSGLSCVSIPTVKKLNSVDVFNVYVSEAGGIGPAAEIFSIAEAAHIPCIIGSMPELGIGTAAQAHLAFAMRNLGYASDVNGFVYHSDDIIQESLVIQDGYLLPPKGPGLGITIDEEKLTHYRID